MAELVIEVRHLSKTFHRIVGARSLTAVKDVSFSIARGEVFGLLGPNGAGKTTLIKLLLGLSRPTSGTITLLGSPPTDASVRQKISFVTELPYLYRSFSPRELLFFYGNLFGYETELIAERIPYLLMIVGLEKAQDRRLVQFSKGMLQRLNIAIGLLNDPDIVFLDEPMLGLDPVASRDIHNLLMRLRREGKTLFVTSHVLHRMGELCDTVAFMVDGTFACIKRREEFSQKRRGAIRLIIEGLPHTSVTTLDEFVRGNGGRIAEMGPADVSLDDIFVELFGGKS